MINGIVRGLIIWPAILRTALFWLFSCFRITLYGEYTPGRYGLSINICLCLPHAKSPERNCPGFSASQYKEAHQMDLYIKRAVRRTIRPNELLLIDYTRRPALYLKRCSPILPVSSSPKVACLLCRLRLYLPNRRRCCFVLLGSVFGLGLVGWWLVWRVRSITVRRP